MENKEQLIIETKKAIGYTDLRNTCRACKYCKEEPDYMQDRSWHWECSVNSICTFTVAPDATCKLFTPLNKPTVIN